MRLSLYCLCSSRGRGREEKKDKEEALEPDDEAELEAELRRVAEEDAREAEEAMVLQVAKKSGKPHVNVVFIGHVGEMYFNVDSRDR